MSRVIQVTMTQEDHFIEVAVTKAFGPEHGGGTQTFREIVSDWADAVTVAGMMLTSGAEVTRG